MAAESLFAYVPSLVVYRRTPLEADCNALEAWQQAAERFVKPRDESDLWGELIYGSSEANGELAFPAKDRGWANRILGENAAALELLDKGLARGRLQFPEFHGLKQIPADSEFVCKLGEVARLPLIRFKILAADGQYTAAADELVRLQQIGEMICNGDGQVLHYLIGLWIRSAALRGIERLARHTGTPSGGLERLVEAVNGELHTPDGLAQSVRVDFCSISLSQLDATTEDADLEKVVSRIMDLYYTPRRDGAAKPAAWRLVSDSEDLLARRRQQVMTLLEDHPKPFDKFATARMMGAVIGRMIHDLLRAEKTRFVALAGKLHQLRSHLQRNGLTRKMKSWPVELAPGFPYELFERENDAPQDPASEMLPAVRDPLSDDKIAAARARLRRVANPIGLLLVEHLMTFDYSSFMFEHRVKLLRVRRLLRARL